MIDNESLLGLPSELHKIITGVLKATDTTIEDILRKSKALDKKLLNGKISESDYKTKKEALKNKLYFADGDFNRTSLITAFDQHVSELFSLQTRRTDLQFITFSHERQIIDIDLTNFLALFIDARVKAAACDARQHTISEMSENARVSEYTSKDVNLKFDYLLQTLRKNGHNSADDAFFNKYFVSMQQDNHLVTKVLWNGHTYDLPDFRDPTIITLPKDCINAIDAELFEIYNRLCEHLITCSPKNERYMTVDWNSECDKKEFISQYQIESIFLDEYAEGSVIPMFFLRFVEIKKFGIQKEVGNKTITEWTHYRAVLPDNYASKPCSNFFVTYFLRHFKDFSCFMNSRHVVKPKLMTNAENDVADFYYKLPENEEVTFTNNDDLLQQCISRLPEFSREFYNRKFRLDNVYGREMFGRWMFFAASVLDASNTSAQSLCLSNSGGTGKTLMIGDIFGNWLNSSIGKKFYNRPQNSEVFKEDAAARTGVFSSVLNFMDEYDGHSAYDDRSWYKLVTGSNDSESVVSVKGLYQDNKSYDVAHMKFVFCTNTENICLPSSSCRRRTLPLIMNKYESDGLSAETVIKRMKEEMPEFIKAAFLYYRNTLLQDESKYYSLLTQEDYDEFLKSGTMRFKDVLARNDYAFTHDERLLEIYTMTDAGMWSNSPIYQEFLDACDFEYSADYKMTVKDFIDYCTEVYSKNVEFQREELFDMSDDGQVIKTLKGSKFSIWKVWFLKSHAESAICEGQVITQKKALIDSKLVNCIVGLRKRQAKIIVI